tara:strand:- start:14127 stop:18608 length:4482 start_codon:yes stop_codon:yes gene_type:complete
MQQNYKHSFTDSKMQKDLDARLVSPREYRDAVNVAVSRSEGSDVGALENILGNEFISSLGYPGAGLNVRFFIIGWYINEDQDKIYTFVTDYKDNSATKLENKAGPLAYCSIVETDTKTGNSNVLVTGSFLNFSENSPINHVDLIEDLLFWTDNRNQPRQINVSKGATYTKESDVSVAKYYPYQPIKIKREYKLESCIYVKQNLDKRLTPLAASGYDAWYDYFVLDINPSQDVIDVFTDNIGAKGYVEDSNGDRFEFRVAFFQQDGFNPDTPTALDGCFLPAPFDSADNTPGNTNRKYLLFIDRDLDSSIFEAWNESEPVPIEKKYTHTIYLFSENAKDISRAWDDYDQFKMTVSGSVPGSITQFSDTNSTCESLIPSLFYFGTRSRPNNANTGSPNYWSAWNQPPSNTFFTGASPFRIVNAFPSNTATSPASSKDAFIRITHPKIPDTDYVVIGRIIQAPGLTTGTFALQVTPQRYTSLRNGTFDPTFQGLFLEYGIAIGDQISFKLPNKFFKQDFPGDPAFLEDKFVRFSYRFKFDNSEYSLLSPFTQSVFIPKQGGYFQKYIATNKQSASNNDFINQEDQAGQNTIVEFLTNEITQVALDIPLPCPANKLKERFKVDEIEVVYKESTALGLKVIETIPLSDVTSLTSNNFISYNYQSRRPIKTLPDSVITRVYDKVPIRAAAQASAGNRIIYGNFIDAHTSPLTLDYLVGVSAKFTPAFKQYNGSDIAYPNHTLKQNRTYQVGVILQDKYGRSSDVILSALRDSNYEETTGPFANNPVVFGGSTVYTPYFDSVVEKLTTSPTTSQNPRAGIVDWPGNSLKVLFANTIPNTITTNAGYPGLYSNFKTELLYGGTGTTTNISGLISVEFSASSGDISLAVVGDYISFNNTEFEVGAIDLANNVLWVKDNIDTPFSAPNISDPVKLIERNELGFYSYKIVVKQTEQEYYNVYLPSILNGAPIIKPFKLDISGTVNTGTVNNTIVNPAAEPRTFLLLEGMNFTVAGVEYTITNILNNENFTYSPAGTFVSTPNVEFSTKSSKNLVNVTTLLTDNANKVPPGLLETTPVQQQYSPSDTTLYPRVAIQEGYTPSGLYYTSTNQNIPIFPGRRNLKVKAVGNFFALNTDANTAGLYEAKSDPPSANIENVFRLGRDAETALPDSIEPLVFTTYETNPVKSELDIFWETGTTGLIEDLNEAILSADDVVFDISTGSSPWNESTDTTGTPGSQRLLLMTVRNRNGGIIAPASFEECALVNITDQSGNVVYNTDGNGTPISLYTNAGVAKTKVDSTLSNSQFGISLDPRGLLYYSENLQNNYLNFTFRCIINNPLENVYDFPLTFTLRNQAPVRVYGQPPSNVVGITINSGITQTKENSFLPIGAWSNSSVAGTFRATNGANTNNASGFICNLQIVYKIQAYNASTSTWYDFDSKHQGLEIQTYSNPNYASAYGKILFVGDVSNLDGSSINPNPIDLRITATDMNGNGLTTTVSEFRVEFM